MTSKQINQSLQISRTGRDLSNVDDSVLHGCGLPDFKRTNCTLEMAAKMIHHAAMQFNGEFDSIELNAICNVAKKKFQIV